MFLHLWSPKDGAILLTMTEEWPWEHVNVVYVGKIEVQLIDKEDDQPTHVTIPVAEHKLLVSERNRWMDHTRRHEREDPDAYCPNCGIPLVAVEVVMDGMCADREACDARRKLINENDGAYLLTPEGVAWIDPIKGGDSDQ